MLADGAALLAAAVRAACLAKAPRRTIQAVASAVTGVLVRASGSETVPRKFEEGVARPQRTAALVETSSTIASAEELLTALRAARPAQRRKKKERRHAAKEVARKAAAQGGEEGVVPVGGDPGGGGPTSAPADME